MKKTITVNLNGKVFTMDEDAYRLLDNYLNNLRIYFRKEEGSSEIISDFEARIEELFSEKTRLGYEVITIEHVEAVIARVGKPADFADRDEENEEESHLHFTEQRDVKKRFFRNTDDKMLGGICSGIAAYFGWDVLAVRIIFIVLIFATSGTIVPFYLIAWIIFPSAYTAEQKLQMQGKPITVENIGRTVAAEVEQTVHSPDGKGCLSGFVDLSVALMKVFLIGLGILIGLPLLFALIIMIIVLFATLLGVGGGLLGISGGLLGGIPSFFTVTHSPLLATIASLLLIGIPLIALVYWIIAQFAKWKSLNSAVKWVFLAVWIIALTLFLISGIRIHRSYSWNWSYDDSSAIRGNGILSEQTYFLEEPVETVEMDKYLFANLQIEQIPSDELSSIAISGDENLIDQVTYDLYEGQLKLSALKNLSSENNLTIRLQTSGLKGIQSNVAGNIQMNRAFTGDELEIWMRGPGNFRADSLYVQSLIVDSEGIASIHLSGKVQKARMDLSGAGKIEAMELLSDSVYARLEGVGSIRCNPVEYLEGRLQGVGKITYKEEPLTKNTTSSGVGKIGKE